MLLPRKGEENDPNKGSLPMIYFSTPDWVEELYAICEGSNEIKDILKELRDGAAPPMGYHLQQGIILKKGRIVNPINATIMGKIMHYIHDNSHGGNFGYLETYHCAMRDFILQEMKKDVKRLVRECETCQAVKYETTPLVGLLQPLPIPQQAWTVISMDFIKGLPMSNGFNVILVVERFMQFGHFIPLSHPYTVIGVFNLFLNHVFKLHGLPCTIVTNRDLVFLSSF